MNPARGLTAAAIAAAVLLAVSQGAGAQDYSPATQPETRPPLEAPADSGYRIRREGPRTRFGVEPNDQRPVGGDGHEVTGTPQLPDREIVRRIRRAVVTDDGLSSDARSVRIVARRGKVMLSGPVETLREKNALGSKAAKVVGPANVTNALTIEGM